MNRIVELSRRIEAGPDRADAEVRAFLDAHQLPLVSDSSAIFFFYEDRHIHSVHLVHWVFGLESRQPFQRLGQSRAWYLSVQLPHTARVEYKLEVADDHGTRFIHDPHNDRRAFDPFGSNSVCPMPGYRVPRWALPEDGVRPGHMASFTLPSAVYGDKREVSVYLPQEYKPHKRYPLVLCHDGLDYLRYANIQTVLDNLIHRREVHPLVVAFTAGGDRNVEYGADPRQPRFLVEELLPAMTERYGVTREPRARGLMGASFGAVASLYTAWTHPGVFGQLLLQSGSFVFTDVGGHGRSPLFDPVVDFVNRFRTDPGRIDARVFLSCGTFESLIAYNRALRPILRDAGIQVRFEEAQDGHNWVAWRDRLRDGLTWLFPGRLWMTYD